MKCWIELELDAEYDYQPPEAITQDHPGCDESVTLCSARVGKTDITDVLTEAQTKDIEGQILENLHARWEPDDDLKYEMQREALAERDSQRGRHL